MLEAPDRDEPATAILLQGWRQFVTVTPGCGRTPHDFFGSTTCSASPAASPEPVRRQPSCETSGQHLPDQPPRPILPHRDHELSPGAAPWLQQNVLRPAAVAQQCHHSSGLASTSLWVGIRPPLSPIPVLWKTPAVITVLRVLHSMSVRSWLRQAAVDRRPLAAAALFQVSMILPNSRSSALPPFKHPFLGENDLQVLVLPFRCRSMPSLRRLERAHQRNGQALTRLSGQARSLALWKRSLP